MLARVAGQISKVAARVTCDGRAPTISVKVTRFDRPINDMTERLSALATICTEAVLFLLHLNVIVTCGVFLAYRALHGLVGNRLIRLTCSGTIL